MKKVYKIGTVNSIKEDYGLFRSLVDGSLFEVTAEQLEGVDNISQYAFFYSSITGITIPDSVTSIGKWAFRDCSSLTRVTIGNGVTSIDGSAFYKCINLFSVIINATRPPRIQSTTFKSTSLTKIIVPKGSGEAYKSATNWSAYADIIKEAAE